MANGNGKHEDQLDQALEDTFPASDPVAMTQREHRQGTPKQHSQSTAETVKDTARKIQPDYLWLGGAFILGCVVGIAARSAPSMFSSRRGYLDRLFDSGEDLRRKVSSEVSGMKLQRKLRELIDRLH